MKKCELCGKEFPFHLEINGKNRNLKNRKYCLDCSSFNAHNTAKLNDLLEETDINICNNCGREYIYKRKLGAMKTICNSCVVRERRNKLKIAAVNYKGGKCERCGYNKCYAVLEFHHNDPSQKEFSLCRSYVTSWKRIKEELDKCKLLCSNCHREAHATEKLFKK